MTQVQIKVFREILDRKRICHHIERCELTGIRTIRYSIPARLRLGHQYGYNTGQTTVADLPF